jgi:hypothetical protein
MRDILQDIVSHTHNLGFLNIVKVVGDENKTSIDAISDDRRVIMFGETTTPHPEMIGTFGMPQLNKLKFLLDGPDYKEGATIAIYRGNKAGYTDIPLGINFDSATGDIHNDYQFMNVDVINEKVKTGKFRGVTWHVEVEPTLQSIQRFGFQAGANNEHESFLAKTDGDKLVFSFGDTSTHNGEFVFATGVTGKITKAWTWPVSSVLAVLKIADSNNAKISFSNDGAMQITLDSGIATYKYIIPAQA